MKQIFLVGDSIRQDYGSDLEQFVRPDLKVYNKAGLAEAYQNLDIPIGSNVGDSMGLLTYLRNSALWDTVSFDYFAFNCGLHDVKRHRPGDIIQISPAAYGENLRAIIALVRSKGVPVLFINTTMADCTRYAPDAAFTRFDEDVQAYNRIAGEVMAENHVPVIDLYGFTAALGRRGDQLYRDHTHFQPDVIRLQAAFIAGYLNAMV